MDQSAKDLDVQRAVQQGLQAVHARIEAACKRAGRNSDEIALVAVTKYATMEQIQALIQLGHLDLGENRVQQLHERAPLLEAWHKRTAGADAQPLRWHMIGHLQRNKVRQVAPITCLVHSVDTLRLAEELQAYALRVDMSVDILLQVNASGEESKFGLPPAAVIHMAEQIDSMTQLNLRGLMTMAPASANPESVRPVFNRTRELFEELRRTSYVNHEFNVLSMGMSSDFEIAIEAGANVVRVGSAIFGN